MTRFRQWCTLVRAAIKSKSTQSFYDSISTIYDDIFVSHKIHAQNILKILTNTFTCQKDQVYVLDLGCGTGMLSQILATNGFNIIGADISLLSLRRQKQKSQSLNLCQADAAFLPTKSGAFDAVVCLGSWRHFKNMEGVVTEISRVLNFNGIFIVGYFPPAIAGIINVNQKSVNQMLCWCYKVITHKLGYWDRVDCSFVQETEEILQNQFREVQEIESGPGKQLVIALAPTFKTRYFVEVA